MYIQSLTLKSALGEVMKIANKKKSLTSVILGLASAGLGIDIFPLSFLLNYILKDLLWKIAEFYDLKFSSSHLILEHGLSFLFSLAFNTQRRWRLIPFSRF